MSDVSDFSDWLEKELKDRDWRQADLVKRSGVNSGLLSQILSKQRKPGANTARAIARALGMAESEVFQRAGLLSVPLSKDVVRLAEEDASIAETYRVMKTLSRQQRRDVLRFALFVKEDGIPSGAVPYGDEADESYGSGTEDKSKQKPNAKPDR